MEAAKSQEANCHVDFNETVDDARLSASDIKPLLESHAQSWVPMLFSSGRRENDTIRCADITGRKPRKQGSCVIRLRDGGYNDFAPSGSARGGDCLATIQDHFGLHDFPEALRKAGEVLSDIGVSIPRREAVKPTSAPRIAARTAEEDIRHDEPEPEPTSARNTLKARWIFERGSDLTAESPAGRYLACTRGLPLPECADLRAHADLAFKPSKSVSMGYAVPGVVALVRYPDGNETGGIHQTFLSDDGEAPKKLKKEMCGPVRGGAVHLFPMGEDGKLGVAEGIETAIAANSLYGVPTWAALSAGGVEAFAPPEGCRALYIFSDEGEAGESAARKLATRLRADGFPVAVVPPVGDDDFATDYVNGKRRHDELPEPHADITAEAEAAAEGGPTSTDPKHLFSVEEAISRINQEYAFVVVGGRSTIIRETEDAHGTQVVRFMNKEAFHDIHQPLKVYLPNVKEPKQASRLWFNDYRRRQFDGIVFAPEGADPKYYNLWRDFPVKPVPGECGIFLKHVHENICQCDDTLNHWLIGWMAQLVQEPHIKPGTCVVLRGSHGTGKSLVGDVLRSLVRPHGTIISKDAHLTGQFNAHLKQTLVLQVEEALWSGDKKAEGVLKDLITNDEQQLEMKGKDPEMIRNLMRVIITSNNDWVVPAALEERRFAVFDVNPSRKEDTEFFGSLVRQMKNGGREALLHYLLNYDYSDLNLRKVPATQGLVDQKLQSLNPVESWWYDCLSRQSVIEGMDQWLGWIGTDHLYKQYIESCRRLGVRHPRPKNAFIKQLRKVALISPARGSEAQAFIANPDDQGKRPQGYQIEDLSRCRDYFSERVGGEIEWPED